METGHDYYFLTATALEIWRRGDKDGENRMFEALYRIREEKFFPRVIFRNSRVVTEKMKELAEMAFLKAWEGFSGDGKAGRNKIKDRSYTWYFFGIFRNKFLTLLGKEQARIMAETEFGNRYSVAIDFVFEMRATGRFSPETEAILDKTGPDCRQLLIWRFAEGLTHEEIAIRKGIKEESSIKMVSRCKRRFLENRLTSRNILN